MADLPLYMKVKSLIKQAIVRYWPVPLNSLGRPVSHFEANLLFQQVPSQLDATTDVIPDGGIGTDELPIGDIQEVTNQGNKTADWLETGGYAMQSFPAQANPRGIAVVGPATLDFYNQGTVIREIIGEMGPQAVADWLKPFLNSTTPSTGPTVLNAIPNQTITATGDQTYTFPDTTFSGSGLRYSATKADGTTLPLSLSGRTFTIPGALANGPISIKVTATDTAGQSIDTTFTIDVERTVTDLPYIISIIRKYNPATKTLYYLAKSSYQGGDVSKQAIARSRRYDETTWRGDFGSTLPTGPDNFPDDYANGYHVFWYGNLSNDGELTTRTIVQFKPYTGAPDSTIISLDYNQTAAQDYGTVCYTYSTGSAKIKAFYVGRNAGASASLSFYADGSGTLKTNLVATGSTAAYSPSLKAMLTEAGGYNRPGLFDGYLPYGSLYPACPNGTYNASIIDEDGITLTYAITVTDSGPISVLLVPTGTTGTGGSGSSDTTGYTIGGFYSL